MTHPRDSFSPFIERRPNGRRLVIPDIHGCARTFTALLQRVGLQPEDQLFLLGDYIDRGPDSGGVLDKIMQLQADGYAVYPLRGNHEQYLLEAYEYYNAATFRQYLTMNECAGLLDARGDLVPAYRHFIANLPYYYELDEFYLVHAGFQWSANAPYSPEVFEPGRPMLEVRDFRATPIQTRNKRVVHGHQVTNLVDIERSIAQKNTVIPLDNGCCFAHMGQEYLTLGSVVVGNLCCLELDTLTLIRQPNVDYD